MIRAFNTITTIIYVHLLLGSTSLLVGLHPLKPYSTTNFILSPLSEQLLVLLAFLLGLCTQLQSTDN